MKRRGFTLLEILTVISIIAILAAILFPVFAHAREMSRKAWCANNLRQIGAALHLYAQAYDGHFPKHNNDMGQLLKYTSSKHIFECPSDSMIVDDWETQVRRPEFSKLHLPSVYSSYVYKGGLTNDDRNDVIIAGEGQPLHGRAVNVLYLGGRVKSVNADRYMPVVEPAKLPDPDRPPGIGPIPPQPPMPKPQSSHRK